MLSSFTYTNGTGKVLYEARIHKQKFSNSDIRDDECRIDGFIGESTSIAKITRLTRIIAESDTLTVLIEGESGTGKELIARAIHKYSNRNRAPFIAVNCAALPSTLIESELFGHEKGAFTGAVTTRKGIFEEAGGGTLFLDEIGELSYEAQGKLLRIVENRVFRRVGGKNDLHTHCRIVAATNRDLNQEIADGRFRLDLYERISADEIGVPPLRERGEDVLILTRHFLSKYLPKKKLSTEVEVILKNYHWPGNVRELEKIIMRACRYSESNIITIDVIPDYLRRNIYSSNEIIIKVVYKRGESIITTLATVLMELYNEVYKQNGAHSATAREFQVDRTTLLGWLKLIDKKGFHKARIFKKGLKVM